MKHQKTKLLPSQKEAVTNWMHEHDGELARTRHLGLALEWGFPQMLVLSVSIVDRSCRYRDAIVCWYATVPQPNKTTRFVEFRTTLELTPTGLIRQEITERVRDFFVDTDPEEDILPLEGVTLDIATPETKIKRSLFKTRSESFGKPKAKNPIQLTLPLGETEQKFLDLNDNFGNYPIYSSKELTETFQEIYSLEWGKVSLPLLVIQALKKYKCSLDEWEWFVQMSLVIPQKQQLTRLLPLIEQIPVFRKCDLMHQFQEPVTISLSTQSVQQVKSR